MQTEKRQYFYTDRGQFRKTTTNENKFKLKFPAIYDEVIAYNSNRYITDWCEKVYCYLHEITKNPICKCGCGREVNFGQVKKSSRFGYNVFCSDECKKIAYKGERNAFYNKHHSIETKNLIGDNNRGRKYSDEVNAKKSLPKEKNGMFGRRNYDVWLEKFGKEIADEKELASNAKKGRKGDLNGMYGKSPGKKAGNSVKCWYKEFFCRSLTELSFIVNYCERFNLTCVTAETELFKVKLSDSRTYKPDFIVNGKFIVEIKPKAFHFMNAEKFKFVKEEFENRGFTFKVIDPIKKLVYNDVFKMIKNNKIKIQVVENGKAYNNFMEKYKSWLTKQ